MKSTSKLVMVVIVLVSALLIGCGSKPADVSTSAARIAEFSLPEGYQPEMAADLGGYSIVMYNSGDGHSHLYLVQAPESKDLSQAKLEEMLGQTQSGKKDRATRMTVVEKRAASIRGQESTLVISEGTNSDGDPYRQVTAAFQGKGGPALLVMSEPTSRWDDARVNQLIASIQ
jgi:hypothetical protein